MKWLITLLVGILPLICLADVFDYPVRDNPERQQALQQLTSRVQQQPQVTGYFEQTRTLAILKNPVISRGRFSLQPEQFDWQVQEPFDISYRFSGKTLVRSIEGETETIAPAAEPMLYGFFSFFFSLFSLSESSLEKFFEVYHQPADDDHWTMGLKPRQAAIARSLKTLVIEGVGTDIQQVRLTEASGDFMVLDFRYEAAGRPVDQ